ncbi:MAG: hypothetical protein ACRESS_09835 [Stenotrophobium sp.]
METHLEFIIGPCNREAWEVTERFLSHRGYAFLHVICEAGGCSALLSSMARRIRERGMSVDEWTAEERPWRDENLDALDFLFIHSSYYLLDMPHRQLELKARFLKLAAQGSRIAADFDAERFGDQPLGRQLGVELERAYNCASVQPERPADGPVPRAAEFVARIESLDHATAAGIARQHLERQRMDITPQAFDELLMLPNCFHARALINYIFISGAHARLRGSRVIEDVDIQRLATRLCRECME